MLAGFVPPEKQMYSPALLKIPVFGSCNCWVICHQFSVSISCLACTSVLTGAVLSGRCDQEKNQDKKRKTCSGRVGSVGRAQIPCSGKCLGALWDRLHSPSCCLPHPSASPGTVWGVNLQSPEFLASLQSSSDPCWLPESGMCLLGIGSGWSQRSFKQLGADKV